MVFWRKKTSGATPDFDAFFRQHADFVFRCARARGISEAESEDVVQDVFLVVHRKLNELVQAKAAKAWLYRIAENVIRDHRRAFARKREDALQQTSESGETHIPDDVTPEDRLLANETVDKFLSVLATLPDAQREVYWLSEIEELTAPEIAELTGVPLNTVYSRQRLARAGYERASTKAPAPRVELAVR